MIWVRIDTDLEDHPKFHALLARRRWSTERGLAFFYRLLRTVRRNAPSGLLAKWDDAYLGRMTNVRNPAGLLADLVAIGIVDETPQGFILHGWMERNGDFLRANATSEARAAGGRKGGATRAATAYRDSTGRYKGSLDGSLDRVWRESRPDSNQTHQSEQEQEQEQEPKDYARPSDSLSRDHPRSGAISPDNPLTGSVSELNQAPARGRPTREDVAEYCKTRGKGVDSEQWYDHYESNGWRVGRNVMKDWKAAVRSWERNGFRQPKSGKMSAAMLYALAKETGL